MRLKVLQELLPLARLCPYTIQKRKACCLGAGLEIQKTVQDLPARAIKKARPPEYHRSAPPRQKMYCDAHSVQVVSTMENSLVSDYELAAFISPVCTIHSNSTIPQRNGKILTRYDGFPCARGIKCLAARMETESVISGAGTEEHTTTDAHALNSAGNIPGLEATADTALGSAGHSPGHSPGLKAAGDGGAAEKTNATLPVLIHPSNTSSPLLSTSQTMRLLVLTGLHRHFPASISTFFALRRREEPGRCAPGATGLCHLRGVSRSIIFAEGARDLGFSNRHGVWSTWRREDTTVQF